MKSFYEFVQLLKENEQAGLVANQAPANQPRTGEERRRHFGIQGTGGGRTDDAVIYNDLSVDYEGHTGGQMIVWFEDDKDLDSIDNEPDEVVLGYGDVSGKWDLKYNFTVVLTQDPSKTYPPGPNGWPNSVPNAHGSGIVKIEIRDIEERPDERDYYDDRDDYNPDPDGNAYWDNYWKHGPGRDPN
jgi:hypothetical protein